MCWFILTLLFSTLVALVSIGRLSEREKDLEILLIRKRVSISQRNREQTVRATPTEKLTLDVFTAKLKEIINRSAKELGELLRPSQPETYWDDIKNIPLPVG